MCDLDSKIRELKEIQAELNTYFSELNNELSIVDKEIVDLEHYIEFYNFSASQGYNAYKMLQERFIKRREIKNKLDKCSIIWNGNIKEFADNRSVINKINGLKNKKYNPRILKELFQV